jgi:TonB family protein
MKDPMFAQLSPGTGRRQKWFLAASVAAHAVLLACLLRPLEPILLNPVSMLVGHNGHSVTRIYWATKSPDNSEHSSSDKATQRYQRQRFSHDQLALNAPQPARPSPAATHTEKQDESPTQSLSAMGHGVQEGVPYGTLHGQLSNIDVRPALPIATSDPVVYPWQLPTSPGNEVIEITIDERGEITNKVVLQSLGSAIDSKCLAALENWHFHPATRNGAPIPSKQDAIFPFKARG